MHGYLRCALAWRPGPDALAVQAQEIGSSTSFVLTRHCGPEGPAGDVVRTEGEQAVLPASGSAARPKGEPADLADPAYLAELADLEGGIERAVDSGEALAEAEDRLQSWLGRADEGGWAAAERWLRSRVPIEGDHETTDDALPAATLGEARTAGRYAISFREDDTPTGPAAALATWDRIARHAREILGQQTAAPADGTTVEHPVSGVRLVLDRTSGRYELSVPLPDDDTALAAVALEQLYQLALTVQLETGRRAVDPQLGQYVDRLGGATWARRFGLFARAIRSFRPGRPWK
ncbi:hypothetical protein ACIQZO_31260 [Streptomyces sp. NPDC097617]|uniref:hypothetical protein n=1 Tax=Streptomyces sp. NPDC097617 TaxID=3366091 RepID=UPI00381BDF2C